jgi:hypothetical protein
MQNSQFLVSPINSHIVINSEMILTNHSQYSLLIWLKFISYQQSSIEQFFFHSLCNNECETHYSASS